LHNIAGSQTLINLGRLPLARTFLLDAYLSEKIDDLSGWLRCGAHRDRIIKRKHGAEKEEEKDFTGTVGHQSILSNFRLKQERM